MRVGQHVIGEPAGSIAGRWLARGAKPSPRDTVDVIESCEPRCRVVDRMRRLAIAGKEDDCATRPTRINHFQCNAGVDGDESGPRPLTAERLELALASAPSRGTTVQLRDRVAVDAFQLDFGERTTLTSNVPVTHYRPREAPRPSRSGRPETKCHGIGERLPTK